MRSQKGSLEVKHIGTDESHIILEIPNVKTEYAIVNRFLISGVEWNIRTICLVYTNHIYKRTGKCNQYNPQHHAEYNDLVLSMANVLFNRLNGSKCDMIELGIKLIKPLKIPLSETDQLQYRTSYFGLDNFRCGSGSISRKYKPDGSNIIQLSILHKDTNGYFAPQLNPLYKPYFRVSTRNWDWK
jgi:hypothetical protein